MKPAPKIYRTRRVKGKFLIDADANSGLETRSFYQPTPLDRHSLSQSKKQAYSVNEDLDFSMEPGFKNPRREAKVRATSTQGELQGKDIPTTRKTFEVPKLSLDEMVRGNSRNSGRGLEKPRTTSNVIFYDQPTRYNRFLTQRRSPEQSNSARQFRFLKQYSQTDNPGRFHTQESLDFSERRRLSTRTDSAIGNLQKSPEDIQNKLSVLFNKLFVYLSKIESLKMKINKISGEGNCYALFRRFCDPESGEMGTGELNVMFESLDFPVDPLLLIKMVIYLKKFEQGSFSLGPPDPGQKNNLFKTPGNRNARRSRVHSSCDVRLKYEDFRELFTSHKLVVPEVYLFCNWQSTDPELQNVIPRSEYYLMRQILVLFGRQLVDVSRILRSLRLYSAREVFHFLLQFEGGPRKLEGTPSALTRLPSLSNNRASFLKQSPEPIGKEADALFFETFHQQRPISQSLAYPLEPHLDLLPPRQKSVKSLSGNAFHSSPHVESPMNNVQKGHWGEGPSPGPEDKERHFLGVQGIKRFLDFCDIQ